MNEIFTTFFKFYILSSFITTGDCFIHLTDCYTGQTFSSLQGHAGNIMTVYSNDHVHLLCSGSADKTVRLWDLRMAKSVDLISTSSCVTSVCFNHSQDCILASGELSINCLQCISIKFMKIGFSLMECFQQLINVTCL